MAFCQPMAFRFACSDRDAVSPSDRDAVSYSDSDTNADRHTVTGRYANIRFRYGRCSDA